MCRVKFVRNHLWLCISHTLPSQFIAVSISTVQGFPLEAIENCRRCMALESGTPRSTSVHLLMGMELWEIGDESAAGYFIQKA